VGQVPDLPKATKTGPARLTLKCATIRDLKFVFRSLGRNCSLIAAAVLSLALGIGANTAIFTLTDQILLRVLPVKEPQRLVQFHWTGRFIGGSTRGYKDSFSYRAYTDLRDGKPAAFIDTAARYQDTVDIADNGLAQRATAELVSGNYFDVLGVSIHAPNESRSSTSPTPSSSPTLRKATASCKISSPNRCAYCWPWSGL